MSYIPPLDIRSPLEANQPTMLAGSDLQTALEKKLITDSKTLRNLTAAELKGLDISKLSRTTTGDIFPSSYTAEEVLIQRERFDALDSEGIQRLLEKNQLSYSHYAYLSPKHLVGLKLQLPNIDTLRYLFLDALDIVEQKKRMASFSITDIEDALNTGDLVFIPVFKIFSQEQLAAFRLHILSQGKVDLLLKHRSENERIEIRKQFSYLTVDTIQASFHKGLLNRNHFSLLSQTQIRGLNFSTIPLEIICFDYHLDPEFMNKLLPKQAQDLLDRFQPADIEPGARLTPEAFEAADAESIINNPLLDRGLLQFLSAKQLNGLDISRWNDEIVNAIFPFSKTAEDFKIQKRRFAALAPAGVQTAIKSWHRVPQLAHLASLHQLIGLALSALNPEIINDVFDDFYLDIPAERDALTTLKKDAFARVSVEDLQIVLESESVFLINNSVYKLFSPQQLRGLKWDRLSKEVFEKTIRYTDAVSHFTSENIQQAAEKNLISEYMIFRFSKEQIGGLKLHRFPKQVIDSSFPAPRTMNDLDESSIKMWYIGFDTKGYDFIRAKEFFGYFPAADVSAAFGKNLLNAYHTLLLSDEQIKQLNILVLSQPIVNFIHYSNVFRNKLSQKQIQDLTDRLTTKTATGNSSATSSKDAASGPNIHEQILGVEARANKEAIKAAKNKLLLQFHPDKVHQQQGETDAAYNERKESSRQRCLEVIAAAEALLGG